MDNPAPIGGRPGRAVSRRHRPGPAADGTLRPPLTARAVLLSAGLMTVLLAVIVLVVVHPPGPLDERTLADQRNGLLRNGPVLPSSVSGVDFGTEPVVLLFLRHAPDPADARTFAAALTPRVRLRLVVQTAARPDARGLPAPVVQDPDEVLARAVDLPRPNDRGPGVGYAVIDSTRTVRYSTLDPSWATNGFEAATIAGGGP